MLTWGAAGIGACFVAFLFYEGLFVEREPLLPRLDYAERPFDEELWKSTHTHSDSVTRMQMVPDLRRNFLPRGLERATVHDVLGTPDGTMGDTKLPSDLYWVCRRGLVLADSWYLAIDYKEGRVWDVGFFPGD